MSPGEKVATELANAEMERRKNRRKLSVRERAALDAANAAGDETTPYAVMRQAICDYFDALRWPARKRSEALDYPKAKRILMETCQRVIDGI